MEVNVVDGILFSNTLYSC